MTFNRARAVGQSSTAPIRVLHLIPSLEVGGAERSLFNLVAGLDHAQFESCVVSMTGQGALGAALDAPLRSLDMRRGQPTLHAWLALRRILREYRPDIVQTWLYHADLLGLMALGFRHRPVLCWNIRCSNMKLAHYRPLTRLVIWLLARCASRPAAIIANSVAGRDFHIKLGYRPRQWEVIPNGFDTACFAPDPTARAALRAELGIATDAPLIGLVGRRDPQKDHETFLQAARRVRERLPAARFAIVGLGVPDLASRVAALGLSEAVLLLDQRADMPRVMAAFDIGCLSSAFGEGFPNVLGEMMACGVPCVSTAVGDAALIVADTGIVVPPAAPESLAEALLSMWAAGQTARRAQGSAARARIDAHYSMARTIERYAALYRQLGAQ